MKNLLIILFLTLITVKVESQTMAIIGDTTLYNRYTIPLLEETKSPNFLDSKNDFNFRLEYYGQIIDISKKDNQIIGTLTNYIYKLGKKRKTISAKSSLNNSLALQTYQLIYDSEVLDLKTDKEIKDWKQGADGITYIIEHSDKNNYWYKTYWTPSIQDSIPEAITINNFIANISNILDLRENYKRFRDQIPHNGCYGNGSLAIICYQPNNYQVGYSGSTRLPLGYMLDLNIGYIGTHKTNLGLSIIHQMDTHGNYNLSASIAKSNIIIRNKKHTNDFALYVYKSRKSNKIENGKRYQNHKILYGLNLKSTALAIGVDLLDAEKAKTGSAIFINQYISRPRLVIKSQTSVFKDQFDYHLEVNKSLPIKNFRDFSIGLYYERFAKSKNLGWSLSTYL